MNFKPVFIRRSLLDPIRPLFGLFDYYYTVDHLSLEIGDVHAQL